MAELMAGCPSSETGLADGLLERLLQDGSIRMMPPFFDIDLLIVGNVTLEEILALLADVEPSLGRLVNPTIYSLAEFRSKLASGNHFLNAVVRADKVFLVGDEDELGKVADYGWVRREPTSQNEIKSLMSIVDRDLKDAGVRAISEDRRFEAAFNAARTAANLALRACGYRTSKHRHIARI
jgi:hypothetical protein